ncbi:hypothetical protein DNTS_028426 [Danionella cerebrum]|uniref:RRM domain-containing protein n=1 Tax=Danionella cerebrum TaxID=2873325 RepID=A0A553NW50_9TELE|nr:hypothetical protein DNTS_028426 [Danionella translucida]TRY69662.1 hypothetical protein DNTS_028426 [Danionella translucida]
MIVMCLDESLMQSAVDAVENASILSGGSTQDGHRLWIGNLDPKITEEFHFRVLQIFHSNRHRVVKSYNVRKMAQSKLEREVAGKDVGDAQVNLQLRENLQQFSACPTAHESCGHGSLQNSPLYSLFVSKAQVQFHLVKLLEKFGKVKQFDFLFHKSGPLEGQPRGYCFVNFHTKEKYEPFKGEKTLVCSLEPSCSEVKAAPTNMSVNAKIRAIEAKLQMMEQNPDDFTGPSPYIYNKPTDKKDKRSQPYHKPFRKFRR